jgi:hypothetical protein
METTRRWRAVALVAGGLFVGSLLGPPLARATTAVLATIKGKDLLTLVSHNAGVNGAGQLETSQADPSSLVLASFYGPDSPCTSGSGFYTVPTGKALIITGATFAYGEGYGLLDAGPPAEGGCDVTVAQDVSSISTDAAKDTTQYQQFQPGIAVPSGDQLASISADQEGIVYVYGYLVPGSTVSSITAFRNLPRMEVRNGRPVVHDGRPVFSLNR